MQEVRSAEDAELELQAVQLELVPGKAPSPAVEYELPTQSVHCVAWPWTAKVPAAQGAHIWTESELVTEAGFAKPVAPDHEPALHWPAHELVG